ncbi:hypothetical protein EYF80_006224 [Liparis tanakae]|uniref:Uncharacterized protein n=1 Tax=Liparis tanakae TaxID=230148 RepID=A0A4Z2J0L6_9TELE|nr:hypothetical protein EYF80_006224 [Liparis tanakae]
MTNIKYKYMPTDNQGPASRRKAIFGLDSTGVSSGSAVGEVDLMDWEREPADEQLCDRMALVFPARATDSRPEVDLLPATGP